MAKNSFSWKGEKKFLNNFNDEISQLQDRTLEGLIRAVIVLQRAAEPGTPIDTGNMRASWFTVTYKNDVSKRVFTKSGSFPKPNPQITAQHQAVKQAAQGAAELIGSDETPILVFGYTANYSVIVHEMVDANFQRSSAHARWLYKALQVSKQQMLRKIQKYSKFK
jgi:hypothetical protein